MFAQQLILQLENGTYIHIKRGLVHDDQAGTITLTDLDAQDAAKKLHKEPFG